MGPEINRSPKSPKIKVYAVTVYVLYFFKANFSAIEASDDFNFFMNHFEAVACYLNALENETSDARED